jgi:Domain of unknown function (DUF4864)
MRPDSPAKVKPLCGGARLKVGQLELEAIMGPAMRMVGAAAVAMTLFIGTASAEDLTAASSRAIVERQFDAFARDDGEAAYALAAPTIKEMFDDADQFMAMVRDDYAPVYRHRSAEFGAFKQEGDEASLEATLVDNDNVVWTALYSFRRVPNGDWLISGCVLAKAEGSAI